MIEQLAKDVRIRAQTALGDSPIYALREVRVDQVGQSLLLSGQVDSFYHKQLAQEAVRAVASGCDVINSIAVDNGSPSRRPR